MAADERSGMLRTRFEVRHAEIQWRGLQRDATVVFALVLCGGALSAGVWAILAPIPLLFLGSIWSQHDQRIGRNAQYLRSDLEPAMMGIDGIVGFEDFLDSVESGRSTRKRMRFSSTIARLVFPTLQLAMLVYGTHRFIQVGTFDRTSVVLVSVAVFIGLVVTLLTFIKVKHRRYA